MTTTISWRTDTENAPRDGQLILARFYELDCPLIIAVFWSNDHHCWFDDFGRSYAHNLLLSWTHLKELPPC